MGAATSDSIDEPAAAAPGSAAAGSTSSAQVPPPSTPVGDLLRALSCALLVAACLASPGSAPLIAPFVPVLVALRLLRQRAGARSFLVGATGASVAAAAMTFQGSAVGTVDVLLAFAAALILVPLLGLIHARAALRDPIVEAGAQPEWPEPRLGSGLSLALVGWMGSVAVIAALAWPAVDAPRAAANDFIDRMFEPYLEGCDAPELSASRAEFCASLEERRNVIEGVVADHGGELLAVLLGVFAWGAAVTAHPIVLARLAAVPRVRPRWRLRELEVHWSAAYLVAIGLAGWMAGPGGPAAAELARLVALALGTVGALLLVTQGVGLAAWLLTRRRTPRWYRAFLVIVALLASGPALVALFVLGVLDMALHPRRRAAKSGSLPGRGSGS